MTRNKMENYSIVRKLGSGNFAKVYLAIHTPTGRQVALKLIEKAKVNNSPSNNEMLQKVRREAANMKKLTAHPNIVELYESFETDDYHVLSMEYVSGGELFEYIQQCQGLSESEAKDTFWHIVEAVEHCHKSSVVHRDLKLENILLDKEGIPKLADFGFSKAPHSREMLGTYCGSPLYASPEMIMGKPYVGPECDVWSLGIILYTMLTATMPFDDRDFPHFIRALRDGCYAEPAGTSVVVRDLISKMLDPNPSTRATIEEILSHPWLQRSKAPAITAKSRKNNVYYTNAEALAIRNALIRNALIDLHCDCDCSCHNESKAHRDSVITKHCSDCEEILSNDPAKMCGVSRSSSGYSSANGSMLFTPRISLVDGVTAAGAERRTSVPHRNSICSKLPASPQIAEIDDDDDEEIVFV